MTEDRASDHFGTNGFAAGGKLRPAGDLLREIADDAEGLLTEAHLA